MIALLARVDELLVRTLPGGTESFHARIAFDESAAVTVRVSREEHAILHAALAKGSRFTVALRPAAPTIEALATREAQS